MYIRYIISCKYVFTYYIYVFKYTNAVLLYNHYTHIDCIKAKLVIPTPKQLSFPDNSQTTISVNGNVNVFVSFPDFRGVGDYIKGKTSFILKLMLK